MKHIIALFVAKVSKNPHFLLLEEPPPSHREWRDLPRHNSGLNFPSCPQTLKNMLYQRCWKEFIFVKKYNRENHHHYHHQWGFRGVPGTVLGTGTRSVADTFGL